MPPRRASVACPAMPSAARPCACCQRSSAAAVSAPKKPSTGQRYTPRPRERELEHGDVPPEGAPLEHAPRAQRTPERPERGPRLPAGDAVDRKARALLERAHRGPRAGPVDRVDRPVVEPPRAQGDLEPGNLRAHLRHRGFSAGCHRRGNEGESESGRSCCGENLRHRGPGGSARDRLSSSSRGAVPGQRGARAIWRRG